MLNLFWNFQLRKNNQNCIIDTYIHTHTHSFSFMGCQDHTSIFLQLCKIPRFTYHPQKPHIFNWPIIDPIWFQFIILPPRTHVNEHHPITYRSHTYIHTYIEKEKNSRSACTVIGDHIFNKKLSTRCELSHCEKNDK